MFNADIHPVFKPLFGATDYLGDEAVIKMVKDRAKKQIHQRLQPINRQLGKQDWLVGVRSIVDPYLFVITRWCQAMDIELDDLTHIVGLPRADELRTGCTESSRRRRAGMKEREEHRGCQS